MSTMQRLVAAAGLAVLVALSWYPRPGNASGYDWLQFDGDAQHSGNNTQETRLTPNNVSSLQQVFRDTLSSYQAGTADSTPVYLGGVSTPGGTKDLLFLTTKDGHILALDAHAHTTAAVWSHGFGGSCTSSNGSPCITTSSPAIDPNRQSVYSYGLDGSIHKYQVGDGTEITGNGWPELATNKPTVEKSSPALSIATTGSGT